jgi:hypothetical protein
MPNDVLIWLADHLPLVAPHLAEEPVEEDDYDINGVEIDDDD